MTDEEKDKLIKFLKKRKKINEEEEKKAEIIIDSNSNVEEVKIFLKFKLGISEKAIDSMGLDGNDLLTLNENEIKNEQYLTLEEKDKLINYVKNKNKIGFKGFKKLFALDNNLRNEINKYKSRKTFVHFEFFDYSEKIDFHKIKLVSIEKDLMIDNNKIISFEYNNIKYPYKSEISEEKILFKNGIEQRFLITIKRNSDNYYKILKNNNNNEKTYSLEIVFFFLKIHLITLII